MEELLSCKKLNLYIVLGISKALEEEYDYAISCFYDDMGINLLEALDKVLKIFCKKTTETFEIVEGIKNGLCIIK